MANDPKASDPKSPRRIDPKDVASSTAAGVASRVGVARSKQAKGDRLIGTGAATGAAREAAGAGSPSGSGSLLTVLIVVAVLFGMLALMLWSSGR